ncbi:hypothetical protein CRG98_033426, partial [Punica granatum]
MAEELVQLFQEASKAADAAAVRVTGGEADESRCLDALKRLKTYPVTSQVLVSTQVGKGIRRLTKHPRKKIQAFASEVIRIWKQIVTEESNGCKRKEAEHGRGTVNVGNDNEVEKDSPFRANEGSENGTVKARKIERNGTPGSNKVEKANFEEKSDDALNRAIPNHSPQKSTPLVNCNDPMRDKVREQLHEALSKVSGEAEEDMIEE